MFTPTRSKPSTASSIQKGLGEQQSILQKSPSKQVTGSFWNRTKSAILNSKAKPVGTHGIPSTVPFDAVLLSTVFGISMERKENISPKKTPNKISAVLKALKAESVEKKDQRLERQEKAEYMKKLEKKEVKEKVRASNTKNKDSNVAGKEQSRSWIPTIRPLAIRKRKPLGDLYTESNSIPASFQPPASPRAPVNKTDHNLLPSKVPQSPSRTQRSIDEELSLMLHLLDDEIYGAKLGQRDDDDADDEREGTRTVRIRKKRVRETKEKKNYAEGTIRDLEGLREVWRGINGME